MSVGVASDIAIDGWAGLGFAMTGAGKKEVRRKTWTNAKVTIQDPL